MIYQAESKTLTLKIDSEEGTTYQTQFIGTLKHEPKDGERIGIVLATSDGLQPSYQLTGDELYVRAVVTSSAEHVDPSFKNQKQQAWTQPVGWE